MLNFYTLLLIFGWALINRKEFKEGKPLMRVMWTRGIRRKDGIGMRGNKRLICVYVAFMLLGAFPVVGVSVASAKTIYVPDNYTKIQWAVDNATAGDTIIVREHTPRTLM